jgi:hypothetical protein
MNGHGVIPYVKSQDSVYMKKRNLQREIHKAAAKRLSGGSVMAGAEPESGKEFAIAVREFCVFEEVWPVGESLGEGGLAAPLADLKVVAFGEDVGDGGASEVGGAGVVGVIEEAAGAVGGAGDAVGGHSVGGGVAFAEALEAGAVGVAEDAGEQADDGVDDDGCGEFASREDVVADGELFVAEELAHALVDAFVAAADEDDAVELAEPAGDGLREALALRGEQDDGLPGRGGFGRVYGAIGFWGDAEGLEALEDGLRLEDHAFAAAEGAVVDGAMAIMGEGAEVVSMGLCLTLAECALENAVVEGATEELGKDGDDVEAHKGKE